MALETASVRFMNLAGNTIAATKAFEGLKAVAKETNTNIVELSEGANTMLEAGIPMSKIDDVMRSTAERARIAGSTCCRDVRYCFARQYARGSFRAPTSDDLQGDRRRSWPAYRRNIKR